ncbi:MAG: undecaprenyl-phosphate glucose phosphotransferase [Rhodanobacter sp.]
MEQVVVARLSVCRSSSIRRIRIVCAAIWILLDMAWLAIGAVIAHAWVHGSLMPWKDWELSLLGVGGACLSLSFIVLGTYTSKRCRKPINAIAYISVIVLLALVVIDHVIFAKNMDTAASHEWLDAWLVTSLALMIITRMLGGTLIRRLDAWIHRKEGGAPHIRRIVIAGEAHYLDKWLQENTLPASDYALTATFAMDGADMQTIGGMLVLRDFDTLVHMARDHCFDELWLALPLSKEEEIRRYVMSLQHHFVDIRLISDAQELPLFNPSATTMGGISFIDLVTSPERDESTWLKPLFDRSFALITLLLLSPLMLAIAFLVKLTSSGPVFFRQRRKGVDGREFTILKFRSMRVHIETAGKLTQAGKNDPRVTPVGRYLRKSSLDELPQFINVLLGQMSVVGPRPHALEHDDFYMRLIDGYMYRYRIKPGITGWAQVNGMRGETAKVESMARRVALDLFYIQHWSFWLDLKIVTMTVFKGFTGRNAY